RLQLPQRLLLLEVVQRVGLEQLPERWIAALGASIQSPSVEVRQQAIRIVTERKIREFDPPLNRLAEDEQQPAELRVEAMLAVAGRSDAVPNDRFRFLTGRLTEDVPPLS